MNLHEKFKAMVPYFRYVGFTPELIPFVRVIIFNNWDVSGFLTENTKIINEVPFQKAKEFDIVFRNENSGTIDDLVEIVQKEIKKNTDRELKEKLIAQKLKDFEEKLKNTDLDALESLDVDGAFAGNNPLGEYKNALEITNNKNESKKTD